MVVEPLTYIMYTRPLPANSGNKIRVYFREFVAHPDPILSRGRSFYIDTATAATIPSLELPLQRAKYFTAKWNDQQLPGMHFSTHAFGKETKQGVVHAHVDDRSKETRKELGALAKAHHLPSNFFLHKHYSGSQDIRFRFPSFTTPTSFGTYEQGGTEGWASPIVKQHSLDDLLFAILHDIHMYKDIETQGWDRPEVEEQIVMVTTGTNKPWIINPFFTKYAPDILKILIHVL
jgi:hypothetical protein